MPSLLDLAASALNRLTFARGAVDFLLVRSQLITATGNTATYTGLSKANALNLTCQVKPVFGSGDGEITVTVEHSDDGETWEELVAFDPADGRAHQQLAASAPFKDNVRVTWTVTDTADWTVTVNARASASFNIAALGGSQPYEPVTITDADSPYTVSAGQLVLADDSDSNGITINLPSSPTIGDQVWILLPTSPSQVTITTTDDSTIEGGSELDLTNQYDSVLVVFNGIEWAILVPGPGYAGSLQASTISAGTVTASNVGAGGSSLNAQGVTVAQVGLGVGGSTSSEITYGSVDPSSGGGVAGFHPGSLYLRNDGSGNGEAWIKTGNGPTAWAKVATV